MKTVIYKGFTIKRNQTPIEWLEEKIIGNMGIISQQEFINPSETTTISRAYLEFLIDCAKNKEDDYQEYWEVWFEDDEPVGFNTLEYAKLHIDNWTK